MSSRLKQPLGAAATASRDVRAERVRYILLVLLGVALGAVGQRLLANERVAPASTEVAASRPMITQGAQAAKPRPRAEPKRFLVRPSELFVAQDAEQEQSYRQRQSQELLNLLLYRLGAFTRALPNEHPEALANQIALYQQGLLDGLMRTAPDLSEALAEHVEQLMCNPKAHDSQLVMTARMLQQMPELASERGFDCVFRQRQGKEDVVLWSMLDAFRQAQLEPSAALGELSRHATDERTLSRLRDDEPHAQLVPSSSGSGDLEGDP